MAARPAAELGTCVVRRGRSPATIDSYRHGLLPAACGGRRWHLLAQPRVDSTGISCMTQRGRGVKTCELRVAHLGWLPVAHLG
jgi:hypothetical protein